MIDAIRADGLIFDNSELTMEELPPIPDWFTNQVNEVGGFFNDDPTKPNVRVVSGLDPSLTEFYGGGWHRKYLRRVTTNYEYFLLHKPNGEKKVLSPAEAKVCPKSAGIVMPVVEKKTSEYGIPRYFVEIYKPPYAYGDRESWESERYLSADEPTNLSGKLLDLMGEFPENGGYDTWFCIEEPVYNAEGKVEATKFKPLDEDVLIFIRYMVERARTTSMAKQHLDNFAKQKHTWQRHVGSLKANVKDIIKDRIDRLTNTPKVTVPDMKGVK